MKMARDGINGVTRAALQCQPDTKSLVAYLAEPLGLLIASGSPLGELLVIGEDVTEEVGIVRSPIAVDEDARSRVRRRGRWLEVAVVASMGGVLRAPFCADSDPHRSRWRHSA